MEFITSEPSQHVKWNNKQNLLKMKNDIDVSVVMSVYNGAKYLRESMRASCHKKMSILSLSLSMMVLLMIPVRYFVNINIQINGSKL